jgi:HSP20 family protein
MLPTTLRNGSLLVPAWAGATNRMDSLFGQILGDVAPVTGRASAPVAIWQDEDHYFVEADLPGVLESDVELTFHEGVLTLRWERKAEEGRAYLYHGRPVGRFERTVTLPGPIDADRVQARLGGGVLRLDIPKSQEARPKKIEIRSA